MLGTASEVQEWDKTGPFTEISSTVSAVCDWCGPTDFYRMNDRPGRYDHDAPDSFESRFLGAPIREVPEKVQLANPVTHINGYCPPFLIMHGKADEAVLPEQSRLLHENLTAKGAKSKLMILPGYGHGFGKIPPEEVLEPVAEFFKKELSVPLRPSSQQPTANSQQPTHNSQLTKDTQC
jgi:dipeptidyl aminopeptidase/acylaminoacyl peptidase